MKRLVTALSVLCLATVWPLSPNTAAADFPVAKQGTALCSIETGKNPDMIILLAAKELQHWVREITGAALEIREEARKPKIVLAVNDTVPELRGNDGYAVRGGNGELRIIGSCPKGVLNGVFRILYRDGGLIWARPEPEIGTVVRKKAELNFCADSRVDVPAFILRGWQCETLKETEEHPLWLARNNANWMTGSPESWRKYGCIMEFGGGHNLTHLYIPEEIYGKSHPDFYPEIDGVRVLPSQFKESCQLCFTNPELLKEFIRRLDKFVKENPDFQVYRVLLEDNYNLCTCKECMKPIHLPDGTVLDGRNLKPQSKEWKIWRSTQFFIWYNKLAEFMKEKYPGKRLLSFGYYFTEFAPKIKVMDNVDISFCPVYRDLKHSLTHAKNAVVLKAVDKWLEQTSNVTWREYYGLNVEYPRPVDRVAYSDYQLVRKRGSRKTYSERVCDVPHLRDRSGTIVWDVGAPYMWSLAQAPWNPDRKVEDVRMEFYERVFGKEAAVHVEKFYSEIEKAWYANSRPSYFNDKPIELWQDCFFSGGLKKVCAGHLADALKKVDTPEGKAMLLRLQKYVLEREPQPVAEKLVIPKATGKVVFDPEFKDPVWQKALVIREFFDDKGKPCPYPTEVRLLHDGKNIYAAMKATRPGLQKMLDPKTAYPQVDTFDFHAQLTDGEHPDCYQMMVDPFNRIYASAAGNRQVPGMRWIHQAQCKGDNWSAFLIVPRSQLARRLKIACFRRYKNIYEKKLKSGFWPTHGAGQKNAVMRRVYTFSPAVLGE